MRIMAEELYARREPDPGFGFSAGKNKGQPGLPFISVKKTTQMIATIDTQRHRDVRSIA